MREELKRFAEDNLTDAELNELFQILEKASDMYYNTGSVMMGDKEFDELKDNYVRHRGDIEIGAEPPEGKGTVSVDHSFGHMVGSLSKVNVIEELEEWVRETVKSLGKRMNKLQILVSYKFDGNSIVAEFKNGKLIKALTRGRNDKGMDLTHVFKDRRIKSKEHVGVKFEVIITYEDFEKLMEEIGETYANPRSMVAGKLGDDEAANFSQYFTLVPLGVSFKDRDYFDMNKQDELVFMKENFPDFTFHPGFTGVVMEAEAGNIKGLVAEIKRFYDYNTAQRKNLPFMIDGLVVEFMDPAFRQLGITSRKPKWATAFKFPYMEANSKVIRMEFDVGKTGRITPMVCFDPVTFNGAVQKRVSLANYKRYESLGLGVGSDVLVQYRNDTLSYVEKLETEFNESADPIPFIDKCPVCQHDVEIRANRKGEYVFAYCSNPECKSKVVGRIERYMEKLDYKGIKGSTIEKLHEAGLASSIISMYTLDLSKVPGIKGLGETAASNIQKFRQHQPYDYEILGGIGIDNFGNTLAKTLLSKFSFYDVLVDCDKMWFKESVMEIPGFSEITATGLIDGLLAHHGELCALYEIIDFKEIRSELEANRDEKLYNIVITGTLNTWKRDELKKILEMRGHKVSGGVSSKTDFLVNNDIESTSGKNKDAKSLGVEIINEETLKERLGL